MPDHSLGMGGDGECETDALRHLANPLARHRRPTRLVRPDATMGCMPPITVGIYEAKARLSDLVRLVEAGNEVTITRHGEPVARLVAIPQEQKETP